MPAEVRAVAQLFTAGEPVSALTTDELGDLLVAAIPGLAFLLGHSRQFIEQPEIEAMAEAVAAEIHLSFARLTWAEISYALRRGVAGRWPRSESDVLLVSLAHITHWLSCYCRTLRTEAQIALRTTAPVAALPAPRIDYVGSVLDLVALAKAKQLPAGFDLDLGNVLYTWLKESGALTGFRTADQYAQMRAEETDRLLARTVPASGPERLELRTFTAALEAEGKLPDAHPLSRSVVNACKKRVLREWLDYFAKGEHDVAGFLADPQGVCKCFRAKPGEVCPDCHDSGRKQLAQAA